MRVIWLMWQEVGNMTDWQEVGNMADGLGKKWVI